MKNVVCEMCGSNDLLKKDGVFECQSCGAKYTVDEVKKMMGSNVSKDRVNNMMHNALQLYEDKKTKEAYQLFSEILNMDVDNYKAIFYKGLCSAWESSINGEGIVDLVKANDRAMDLAKKQLGETNELSHYIVESYHEIENVTSALLSTYENFIRNKNKKMDAEITKMKNAPDRFSIPEYYMKRVEELQKEHQNAIKLFEGSLNLVASMYGITTAKLLNINNKKLLSELEYEGIKIYTQNFLYNWLKTLGEDAQLSVAFVGVKCDEGLKAYKDEKREKYWSKHKEEKEKLEKEIEEKEKLKEKKEKELSRLESKKEELTSKMNDNVPSEEKLNKLVDDKEKLEEEKSSLGLFKISEKKALQEKINALDVEIEDANKLVEEEKGKLKDKYQPEIDKVDSEIDSIKSEIEEAEDIIKTNNEELEMDRD